MNKTVLVTGGTGFLALHIIHQLLQQNFQVRTTVRSLKRADYIKHTMSANGITDLSKLTFVEADLLKDDGWDQAVEDQEYVLSVASPVFFSVPKNEDEMIRPAVEGIQRILTAASKADVKRVVMTSNFGALGFSNLDHNKVTTEQDWTDEQQPGLSLYEKSKLLAEKAAWEFIENDRSGMEFATVNPVAILGPPLDDHTSGSFSVLKMVFGKAFPNLPLNVVDVRDVADIHIRAMTTPEARNQRFIASADGEITLLEIEELIRKERPQLASQLTTRTIPAWAIEIASYFNSRAKEGKLMLAMNRNISNQKAKDVLDWRPMFTKEQTVLDSIDSMVKNGEL
ncbi:SDR family oxidoreductase [Candidatus Enterococcus ferrettii]|uniref:3-beta hydroxysteroid dehydrogenase/isomerase domain-containing protein n=1 Tax=Candidatus Enterococcus ferrettii TaxID=2815324 RepID=A0ABV0ESA4_9ENTE|nr:aldehyde reductase [Enterococcus sp. 665A]MBO1342975.1 aldehyde reductase [Enterococcus sp. 665A]